MSAQATTSVRLVQRALPDLELDDTVIRTPKRGELRAAQVWDAAGHWFLGLYPTRKTARDAAKAFLADPATCPGALRIKRRCFGHTSDSKWVRMVKGNAWQARVWLEGHGPLNLGLFTVADHGKFAEREAAKVARAFGTLWTPGRTVEKAVELLKRHPKHPCRENLRVPAKYRDLLPPSNYGPTEEPEERVERERMEREERLRGRYKGGLLFAA